MADASPALLEAAVLLLSAAALAVAGVALIFLFGGRAVAATTEVQRSTRRRLIVRALGTAIAFPLPATGAAVLLVLWAQPALGSTSEIVLALLAGSAGGILAALLGAAGGAGAVAASDLVDEAASPRARHRAIAGELVGAAAAGGLALAVFLGLYLDNAGHAPPVAAAALGALVAAIGASAASTWSLGGDASPEALAAERAVGRGALAAVRSYALLVTALVGAALLAYVPSVVRFLEPNALLYPAVGAGVIYLAGLLGLATIRIAPAGNARTRSHVPLVAAAAFSSVALLAADSGFFFGNLGLWLSALTGILAAFVLVEGLAWVRATSHESRRALGAGASLWLLVAAIVVAFLLANWKWGPSPFSIDSYLGAYGVALAGVGLASMACVLSPLIAAAAPSLPHREEGADPSMDGLRYGLESLHVLGATMASLVIVWVALYLDPLEYGVQPSTLLGRFGWTDPSFLIGLLLGASLPMVLASVLAWPPSADPPQQWPRRRHSRFAFRDLVALWSSALLAPTVTVLVLGPGALVGLAYATAGVGLLIALVAAPSKDAAPALASRLATLELLVLGVAVTTLVVGGVWFGRSVFGTL